MAAPPIERSRLFVPEHLTPLFHAPIYGELDDDERRTYNQIQGLCFNEHFVFFESTLPAAMLEPLLGRPELAALRGDLERYIAEETEHAGWFRALNRHCEPELYAREDFHFLRVPPLLRRLWSRLPRHLAHFPWLLWLVMIQEEKATWYGREFVRAESELEPRFVEVQRRHLASEDGHDDYTAGLLAHFWDGAGPRTRRRNARLLGWVVREFFTAPRRSGLRVVEAWVERRPALAPRLAELRAQLLALGDDEGYLRSHYAPHTLPRTLERMRRYRELDRLRRYLSGEADRAEAVP